MALVDGEDAENLFEGCGREGPIRAIFLSEFHHIAGPKIVMQYPPDTISKEIFDAISPYIIPKTHLQRLTMTVNALGKKIIGFPIQIKNDKYERNAYYFNTCFVCDAWARTVQYEQVLVKFAEYFYSLEIELGFLSKLQDINDLSNIFEQVLGELNSSKREASIVVKERLLKLKVVPAVLDDPPMIRNHQVPVFIIDTEPNEKWDLTTQQIIPYVNGFNHISKIANLADVDTNLVKTCLQNLLYYKVIKLIPIFQYGNTYCTTPEVHTKLVMGDHTFKNDAINFVARSDHTKPHFADIIRFYCAMKRGVSIKDLCCRFRTMPATPSSKTSLAESRARHLSGMSLSSSSLSRTSSHPTTPVKMLPISVLPPGTAKSPNLHFLDFQSILGVIDERRLVLFGLVHGLIRRVEKYPLLQTALHKTSHSHFDQFDHENREIMSKHRKKASTLYEFFDGNWSYDEICLSQGISQSYLDDIIERDPDLVIIWK